MVLRVPLSQRARRFGYIFWPQAMDEEVERFFGVLKTVEVVFENSYLGEKRIDRAYRRISVGWRQTRRLPREVSTFRLSFKKDGKLYIACE